MCPGDSEFFKLENPRRGWVSRGDGERYRRVGLRWSQQHVARIYCRPRLGDLRRGRWWLLLGAHRDPASPEHSPPGSAERSSVVLPFESWLFAPSPTLHCILRPGEEVSGWWPQRSHIRSTYISTLMCLLYTVDHQTETYLVKRSRSREPILTGTKAPSSKRKWRSLSTAHQWSGPECSCS